MIVVARAAWERLQAQARVGWFGWACSVVLLACTCFAVYRCERLARQVAALQERQDYLNTQSVQITRAQATAWEEQQATIGTLISWAEYVRERMDMKRLNNERPLTKRDGTPYKETP